MYKALRTATAAALVFSGSMFAQKYQTGYIPADRQGASIPDDDFNQEFHSTFEQLQHGLRKASPDEPVHESSAGTVSIDQLRHPLSRRGERLIRTGQKYAQAGDHDKAIDEYTEALTEPSSRPYARSLLGVEYLKSGNLSAATIELSEAVRLMPGEAANHSNLGYAFLLTGKREAAEKELRQAIQLDHRSPQPRYLLGLLLLDQGTQEAAENLSFSERLFTKAHLALAIFHMQHGQSADAEQDLRAYLGPAWTEQGPEVEMWAASAAKLERPSAVFGLPTEGQ